MTTVEALSNGETRPLWQLLFGIVDRPTATFLAVLARRKWWMWAVPLGVVLLCFAATTLTRAPYAAELARQQAQRQLEQMPPAQAEQARASGMMDTFTSLPFLLATGLGFGAVALIVGIVVQAAVLYFGALIAGGEVNFGQVFTMSVWTRIPSAVNFLTLAGFTLVAGRTVQYPGLSALVAVGDMMKDGRNPMVVLLGGIDLFWLWHLLLVGLGLSVVARFSRLKALVLTLIYVALSLAVAVLPTLLLGGASGG